MGAKSKRKNVIASLIFGALFLWLAFRGIDLNALGEALKGADYVYILPAIILMLAQTAQRTLRLNYVISPTHKVGFASGFSINAVGFMAINLFPARLGEFVRPYLLSEREGVPMAVGLAGVLVVRLFDFLSMVAILFIVAIFIPLPVDSIEFFGTSYPVLELGRRMAMFLAGPVVAFVVGLIIFERQVMALARLFVRPLPEGLGHKLLEMVQTFINAIHQIRSPKVGASLALQTAAIWALTPLGQLLVLMAFGIPLGYGAALAILAATLVGLLIPAPPGFAGTYEAFTMAGLALFSVKGETALAYALVVHGIQFFSTVGLGLVFLWKDGISFSSLTRVSANLRGASAEVAEEAGGS